jgi:hypothetical protein
MTSRLGGAQRIFPATNGATPSKLATLALVLATMSVLWSDSWDAACRLDPRSQRIIDRDAQWDATLRRNARGDGLFLRFINFAPADRQSALEFYFRAVNLLYPQSVIVATPGAVILLGWQLINANFDPDDAWLRRQGIAGLQVVDGRSGIAEPGAVRLIGPAPPTPPPRTFSIFWCAIYLGALLVAGDALIGCLGADLNRWERFGFTAILGPGVFGYCLIALSMLTSPPSRGQVLVLGALFAVLAGICRWMRKAKKPVLPPVRMPERLRLVYALLIGYGLVIVALDVSVFSTPVWDAFAIWQLKAKVLATAALVPRPSYFFDVRLSFSHLRYPVLWPMICAGVHAANQSLREGLGKIPAYLFYIGTGASIYGLLRRYRGPTPAIIAASLVLTMPVIYRYGGSGTAEMALTAFYAASIICILRWQEHQRWNDLVLAALFSAAMAWTKNEGQALALINALVILVLTPNPRSRRNLAAVGAFAAILFCLFLPWLLYIRPLPRSDEDYAGRLNFHEMLAHLDRLPTIAMAMARESILFTDWGIFWILLIALALLQRRQMNSRTIVTLWVLLTLQLIAYFPPYMVTIWTLRPLLLLTIDRLFMHMMPAAALLIGLLWPAPPWREIGGTVSDTK